MGRAAVSASFSIARDCSLGLGRICPRACLPACRNARAPEVVVHELRFGGTSERKSCTIAALMAVKGRKRQTANGKRQTASGKRQGVLGEDRRTQNAY